MNLRVCFYFLFLSFLGRAASAQSFKCVQTLNDNVNSPVLLTSQPLESFWTTNNHSVLIQGNKDGSIYFRSFDDGTIIKQVNAHLEAVNYMNFNSTGRLLISTSANGEIRIYDFEQDKMIHHLISSGYEGISFALFSIADGFIYFNARNRLYKTRSDLTQVVEMIYDMTEPLSGGVITPDRSALILAMDKFLYVINTRTDEIVQQIYASDTRIEKLYLMPDSNVLTWSADGTMQIWKLTLGQIQRPAINWFKAGSPGNASFSHHGTKMITGNIGYWSRIWNPMEKNIEQELFGHTGTVTAFAFSPDDKTIFTASSDHTIKIWRQDSLPSKGTLAVKPVSSSNVPKDTVRRSPEKPAVPLTDKGTVVMLSGNIPEKIKGRAVKKTEKIILKKSSVDIYIFDAELVDGDTLSLFFNNEWILKNYGVVREKKKITLNLQPGTNNYLVLFAENLGLKPPNTAVILFSDGKRNRTIRLSSDLAKCSSINFIYRN